MLLGQAQANQIQYNTIQATKHGNVGFARRLGLSLSTEGLAPTAG